MNLHLRRFFVSADFVDFCHSRITALPELALTSRRISSTLTVCEHLGRREAGAGDEGVDRRGLSFADHRSTSFSLVFSNNSAGL